MDSNKNIPKLTRYLDRFFARRTDLNENQTCSKLYNTLLVQLLHRPGKHSTHDVAAFGIVPQIERYCS